MKGEPGEEGGNMKGDAEEEEGVEGLGA